METNQNTLTMRIILLVITIFLLNVDFSFALSVSVQSPLTELSHAKNVIVATAQKKKDAVYLKISRVLKGGLTVGQSYKIAYDSDGILDTDLGYVIYNLCGEKPFVLLCEYYTDNVNGISVYPTKFRWSVWPQGMNLDKFPYKTVQDCVDFIEKNLEAPRNINQIALPPKKVVPPKKTATTQPPSEC